MDSRLSYARLPTWQKGFNQALQGTDLHTIPPTSRYAQSNFEFELPQHVTLLFGPMSGFLVKGTFESKESPSADDSTFTKLGEGCGREVALIPNWFEHLISDIKVFHGNSPIQLHDVPRNADPFLNTYLYSHMSSDLKDYLFPEPHNPGRCVGLTSKDWSFTDDTSVWRKYAKEALEKGEITFRHLPAFLFPFYQEPNLCMSGKYPSALPMQALGRMTVNLGFKDESQHIFLKAEGNLKVYRFSIHSVRLVVEEARLNLAFEKKFLNRKEPLIYQGISRIGTFENINAGLLNYKCTLNNVPYPEGVFVCAIPQKAMGQDFKWSANNTNVFMPHNVECVTIDFQNKPLAMKSPCYGDFRQHMMGIKQLQDYYNHPPFGIFQDKGKINFQDLIEGGDSTIYPHLYFNLTPSGNETRIIPVGDDGQILTKSVDLQIRLDFKTGGATTGAVYLIYIFYSDASIKFDMKMRQFTAIYKRTAFDD